jgi:hypothetical protein
METVNISAADAAALALAEKAEGRTVTTEDLTALGFNVVSGDAAQVVAAQAAPAHTINAELVAAAEVLYEAGRKAKPTASGRTRMVLSEKDGLYPYRVSVTFAE